MGVNVGCALIVQQPLWIRGSDIPPLDNIRIDDVAVGSNARSDSSRMRHIWHLAETDAGPRGIRVDENRVARAIWRSSRLVLEIEQQRRVSPGVMSRNSIRSGNPGAESTTIRRIPCAASSGSDIVRNRCCR